MFETLAFDESQITHPENRSNPKPGDPAPTLDQNGRVSISYTEGSPVPTCPWPGNGPVLGAARAVYGLNSSGCCASCGHDGRLLKMSSDFYPLIKDAISALSCTDWQTSGSMSAGQYWTVSISESRNVGGACSLSDVLATDEVPSRYWLSARAAQGILRRADKRGRVLPPLLVTALELVAQTTSREP